ncbi:GDSL esterase/lipase [Camellia lanceoleosa]|uniref:GDSL esterase/lipase n=1 Tax=Camellia lanceoleosa TaxID=1840588 RepID=A0ACC0GXK8_9ERIC|nr:GDSL esterase/lipase [Camellia lanceoleosa]
MAYKYTPWLIWVQLLILAAAAAAATNTTTTTAGAKVPAVIVFGDSSVDAGNNNQLSTVLKSNFAPYGRDFFGGRATGRFSNGRIPPDFIAEAFGLRPYVPAYLDPMYSISDFAAGVCFASAGTGYDNSTSDVLSVIPLWKELEYYKEYQKKLRAHLGVKAANTIISEALYLTSMGTNDFLENYYTLPGRRSQYNIDQYQNFLVGVAESLTTNFFGGNGGQCVESYNVVAMNFNGKLNGLVGRLNKELPGIKAVFSDPYNIFLRILSKPSAYGFEVASVACCATGMFEMGYMCDQLNPFTCSDANKYVFWDSFHPTEKTNNIISKFVIKHVLHEFF